MKVKNPPNLFSSFNRTDWLPFLREFVLLEGDGRLERGAGSEDDWQLLHPELLCWEDLHCQTLYGYGGLKGNHLQDNPKV